METISINPYDCPPSQEPLELSYFHGACATPLSGKTIRHVLIEAVKARPNHVVFKIPEFNQTLSFDQLLIKSTELAKGFLKLGLKKGDILLCYQLCDEHFFITFLACSFLGLVFFNPYIHRPEDEFFDGIVEKCSPALVIIDAKKDSVIGKYLEHLCQRENKNVPNGIKRPHLTGRVVAVDKREFPGLPSMKELVENGKSVSDETLERAMRKVSNEECVYIVPTSGSSGESKLVCLSQYMLVNYSTFCLPRRSKGRKETIAYMSPVHDDILALFGTVEMICQWRAASVGIVMPKTVDYSDNCVSPLLQFIQDYRISRPACYPFQILHLINSPLLTQYDISSLKGVTLVAQAISLEHRKRIVELFPESMIAYGQCENIGTSATAQMVEGSETFDSVGYPLPHTEVKVVGAEGEILPIDTAGEIWVRGPCRFLGYFREEAKTNEVMDSKGWIHSGDMGKMNCQGYLTLIGRKSDCIRFKHVGEVVYPGHIEKTIQAFEKVIEVKVVGIPLDEGDGDTICACVTKKSDVSLREEELRNYCEHHLLSRDWPQYYFIMDEFPVSGARHKVSRQKLKEHVRNWLINNEEIAVKA